MPSGFLSRLLLYQATQQDSSYHIGVALGLTASQPFLEMLAVFVFWLAA